MEMAASSLVIVEDASSEVITTDWPLETPLVNVTKNASSFSMTSSPMTLTVMSFELSPSSKERVPVGNTPPTKSASVTELPDAALTAQLTLPTPIVLPLRVTVKLKAVESLSPSSFSAAALSIR